MSYAQVPDLRMYIDTSALAWVRQESVRIFCRGGNRQSRPGCGGQGTLQKRIHVAVITPVTVMEQTGIGTGFPSIDIGRSTRLPRAGDRPPSSLDRRVSRQKRLSSLHENSISIYVGGLARQVRTD